jgi:hypothetical protein
MRSRSGKARAAEGTDPPSSNLKQWSMDSAERASIQRRENGVSEDSPDHRFRQRILCSVVRTSARVPSLRFPAAMLSDLRCSAEDGSRSLAITIERALALSGDGRSKNI